MTGSPMGSHGPRQLREIGFGVLDSLAATAYRWLIGRGHYGVWMIVVLSPLNMMSGVGEWDWCIRAFLTRSSCF